MGVIISGLDLTDDTADWWGWRMNAQGAAGFVAPRAHSDGGP